MKNPLPFCDSSLPVFFEPYYVYDLITVMNKSTCLTELRHRATAVSFSDEGQIIVAFTICNPKDNFSKKVAREGSKKAKVLGLNDKIKYMYHHQVKEDDARGIITNSNMTYYFANIDIFNEFVNAHCLAVKDTFMHNHMYYSRLKSYNTGQKLTKIHFDDHDVLQDVLFLKTFINLAYKKFMDHPTIHTAPQLSNQDIVSDFINSNSTI